MKQIIFSLLVILLLGVSSCSNEIPEFAEEPVGDVTLTTTFEVKGVETKSSVVDGDEKKVTELTVFVFRNTDKDTLISKVTKSGITDELSAIKLEIKAKSGDVKIVALANILPAPDVKSYKELCEKTISKNSFVSAELPKFAIKDTNLKVELDQNKNEVKPSISMTLVQLAARVDMKNFVVSGYDNKTFKFEAEIIKVEGINGSSLVVLKEYGQPGFTYNTAKSVPLLSLDNAPAFYTFEQNASIKLTISGMLTETTQGATNAEGKRKEYTLTLMPEVAKGDKTDGFVHGYKYEATGYISAQNEAITYLLKVEPWSIENVGVDYGK